MFHDAPMEAVEAASVKVHRRPKGLSGGTKNVGEDLAATYQLDKVVTFILTYRQRSSPSPTEGEEAVPGAAVEQEPTRGKPMLKVALQFPDNMLDDVTNIVHELEARLHADARYPAYQEALARWHQEEGKRAAAAARPSRGGGALLSSASPAASAMANPNAPTDNTRLFVLADSTFGSCCPDEVTALHYDSDCIVHFGEACMSKSTRLPVLYIHPPVHFNVVAAAEGTTATATAGPSAGEVNLLIAALARFRASIERRRDDWSRKQTPGDSSSSSPLRAAVICPRLVVVGTPSSAELFRLAEKALREEEEAGGNGGSENADGRGAIPVDWCSFDERDDFGVSAALAPSSPSRPSGAGNNPSNGNGGVRGEESSEDDSQWVVNGARFPRLTDAALGGAGQEEGGGSAAGVEVQHFLFVGPSAASHPIHLHGIHQYNSFHYPAHARDYFDEDNSDESRDAAGRSICAPALFVMDQHFATDTGSGSPEGERRRRLSETATREVAHTFLSNVFAQGKGGLAAEGAAAQSAHALRTIHRRLSQRSLNMETVRASSAVGILVASLAIEGYYECTMLLHQLLRAYGKRSYILYVGHLNEFKLANFADTVDCFVVVACPNARHCHFPEKSDNYMKRVVSPAEVLLALTADSSTVVGGSDDGNAEATGDDSSKKGSDTSGARLYGMPGLYNTEFACILPPLRAALAERKKAVAEGVGEGDGRMQERWRESASLIRVVPVGGGVVAATGNTVQGSLARLHEREYVGLDPQIGQTAVQESVLQGKHGIARGYATEREAQKKDTA